MFDITEIELHEARDIDRLKRSLVFPNVGIQVQLTKLYIPIG